MNHDKDTDDFLGAIRRIETSVKNSQSDIKKLYLHSTRQELAIEALTEKVDAGQREFRGHRQEFRQFQQDVHQFQQDVHQFQQETRGRFDKIEDVLAVIVNHLQK